MPKLVWILGASDPEMERIEALLSEANQRVAIAMLDGVRVRPDTAYDARIVAAGKDGATLRVGDADHIVLVECAFAAAQRAGCVTVIDHHRPGDPGYGQPPPRFLDGSALGQVAKLLAAAGVLPVHTPGAVGYDPKWHPARWHYAFTARVGREPRYLFEDGKWLLGAPMGPEGHGPWYVVPQDVVMAAAADHCLARAYRGECPGVDADTLMQWRVACRASFQRRSAAAILRDIERARLWLREQVASGQAVPHAEEPIPELPEAAAREGVAFTARLRERRRERIVLQGAEATLVAAWMKEQRELGRQVYGDPERGFAGAWVS